MNIYIIINFSFLSFFTLCTLSLARVKTSVVLFSLSNSDRLQVGGERDHAPTRFNMAHSHDHLNSRISPMVVRYPLSPWILLWVWRDTRQLPLAKFLSTDPSYITVKGASGGLVKFLSPAPQQRRTNHLENHSKPVFSVNDVEKLWFCGFLSFSMTIYSASLTPIKKWPNPMMSVQSLQCYTTTILLDLTAPQVRRRRSVRSPFLKQVH